MLDNNTRIYPIKKISFELTLKPNLSKGLNYFPNRNKI